MNATQISLLNEVSSHKPYELLLFLGLIIALAKLFSLGLSKFKIPHVVGMLLAGLVVGCLTFVPNDWFQASFSYSQEGLSFFAKVGVILIMFSAGLETDLKKVKSLGVKSVIITSLGVIVPLLFGYLLAFSVNSLTGGSLNMPGIPSVYTEIYYGVILSATSVSITVATLKELHRLDSPVGTALISAAILDDIIGIVLLSLVISLAGSGSGSVDSSTFAGMFLNATGWVDNAAISVTTIIVFMVLFFALSIGLAFLFGKLFNFLGTKYPHHIRITILALAACFLWSYLAEFFSIADITGAFVMGLILSRTSPEKYIDHRSETISDNIFAPVFFACIALNMFSNSGSFSWEFMVFGILWIVAGLLGKVMGAGTGALISKFNFRDSLGIGVGMMARAEVLIVCAQKGVDAGLVDQQIMVHTLALILISSFLTPILLKVIFKGKEPSLIANEGQISHENSNLLNESIDKN